MILKGIGEFSGYHKDHHIPFMLQIIHPSNAISNVPNLADVWEGLNRNTIDHRPLLSIVAIITDFLCFVNHFLERKFILCKNVHFVCIDIQEKRL